MNDTLSPPRQRKRPRTAFMLGAIVLVAAAAYGVHKYRSKNTDEGEYLFATVTRGNIEDLVTSTGTLQPRDFVDVGAQVSGQINLINVEVGDEVKTGQLLVTIDATQSQARVEANRASLRSSETNLETQKNNLVKAERDYQRQVNLFAEDATTRETLLNAETSLISARNQIKQSEATIEQQKANMRIEEKNLQYTQIVAPIDGTIMSIAVKLGQSVNASQVVPNVLRIANLATMEVLSDVSEADVSRLYKNMPVYFTTLGSAQNRRWNGMLKRIEPTPKVQNSVVLYPALFDVENEGGALMPQMTAQVFFVVNEARNVLTVPMSALQQGQQIAREMAMQEREARAAQAAQNDASNAGQTADAAADGSAGSAAPLAAEASQGDAGGPPAGGPPADGPPRGPGGRGGPGGFDPQNMTPEQVEQMRARFAARGGAGGPGGPGGFGGGRGANGGGNTPQPGQVQRRAGTVMVKKADGTLEPRRVVIGVNDRVIGEVIEGLEEGDEVVIGKREAPVAASQPAPAQNNQNFNFRGGGGRPF